MNDMARESLLADIVFGMVIADGIKEANRLQRRKITDWRICKDGVRLTIGSETVLLSIKIEGERS
jgi:hypothetical protein